MSEISSTETSNAYDFGDNANPIVVQAIQDYLDNKSLTDEQLELILEEYDKFIHSNSPEEKIFRLAVREVDFADNNYPYERMVELFKLSGHVGEWSKGIETFVDLVVAYPDDFGNGSDEIISALEDDGDTARYYEEIELFQKYCKMSLTLDRAKLAYGAALDWINTCIQNGQL